MPTQRFMREQKWSSGLLEKKFRPREMWPEMGRLKMLNASVYERV
jgi:hypothetical protein